MERDFPGTAGENLLSNGSIADFYVLNFIRQVGASRRNIREAFKQYRLHLLLIGIFRPRQDHH
jgi:hypothetical protein